MKDTDNQLDAANDPLDRWLADAEFPPVSAESTERLQREWRSIWKVKPRSHGALWVWAAVAAMVCVTTAVGWKLAQVSRVSSPRQMVQVESTTTKSDRSRDVKTTAVSPRVEKVSPHSRASRAPTALELRLLAAIERRERKTGTEPQKPLPQIEIRDPVEFAVDEFDHRDSASAVVSDLLKTTNARSLSRELKVIAARATEPRASAAKCLLAEVGDASTLTAMARDEQNANSLRIAAMASLLRSADDASVAAYLTFASDPTTQPLAMSAVDAVNDPPTDVLLRKLNDSHIATRLTAAAVLGRINGPETTRKLADLVLKNQNRREALIALAASRGPEAKAFLDRAAKTNELSSAVASTMIQTSYQ